MLPTVEPEGDFDPVITGGFFPKPREDPGEPDDVDDDTNDSDD